MKPNLIFFGEPVKQEESKPKTRSSELEEVLFVLGQQGMICMDSGIYAFKDLDATDAAIVYALLKTTEFEKAKKEALFGYAYVYDDPSKGITLDYAKTLVKRFIEQYGFQIYQPDPSKLEEIL